MPWGRFGWSEGYHQRFGVVYVDFETQQRPPKASFGWYRDLIAAGAAGRGRHLGIEYGSRAGVRCGPG